MQGHLKKRAIIPLRSGSKRIPQKNFFEIEGWPLYRFVLNAAIESGVFDEIILATDRLDLIQPEDFLADRVICFERSDFSSCDTATSESVLQEVIDGLGIDDDEIICMVQATSPYCRPAYFREMNTIFMESDAVSSVFTAVNFKRFFVRNVVSKKFRRNRTQDLEGDLLEAGLFWATKVRSFKASGSRISGEYAIVTIEPEDDVDIDTMGELQANIPRLAALKRSFNV